MPRNRPVQAGDMTEAKHAPAKRFREYGRETTTMTTTNLLYVSTKSMTAEPVTPRADSEAGTILAEYHAVRLAFRATPDAESVTIGDTTYNREAFDALAKRAKGPVKFLLAKGATVTRYTVDDDTLTAYRAAGDAKARAKVLTDAKADASKAQSSPIHPAIVHANALRGAYTDFDSLAADLAAGFVSWPVSASKRERAARLTPEQKAAAVAAALFADDDADATDATDAA